MLAQIDYFHWAALPVMMAMAVVAAGISGYFLCWTLFAALLSTLLITVPTAAFAAFMISLTYRGGR